MNDEEFLRRFGTLYYEALSRQKDSDYVVNQPQMDKFIKLVRFFDEEIKRLGGRADPIELSPRMVHGGLTVMFFLYDLSGEKVQEFCETLSACSAVGIEAQTSGEVCLSCTVPNIFVRRDEQSEVSKPKLWYAVMRDKEDTDWGTGSYNYNEARDKALEYRANGDPDAYIAVIKEGFDSVCVDEIHDLEDDLLPEDDFT